jgi:glycosyltransferase involved in cell wall biosynthesis
VKLAIFVPSLNTGGLASLALELGTAAKLRGNEVEIYVHYSSEYLHNSELDVRSLEVPPPRFSFLKPIIALLRLIPAHRKLTRFKPDFVICLDPSSAFLCFAMRALKSNFHLSVACYTPINLLRKSDTAIIRWLYQLADQVVAPSQTTGKNLLQMNSRIKLRIIPNPYSSSSATCSLNPKQPREESNCLYLGRLSKEKGVEQILNIAEDAKDLRFQIAGGGAEEPFLRKEIFQRGIENIELIGWQSPSNCLPKTQVLVLPSLVETFGIVIIESWIHGIPVVASVDADGPRELISEFGGGSLVENYDDCDEWVANIRLQMTKSLSDKFSTEIVTRFSGYELIQEWIDS